MGECGEDVAQGLAAAGLPDGHEVVPAEGDGPALRLDRHRALEAMSLLKQNDTISTQLFLGVNKMSHLSSIFDNEIQGCGRSSRARAYGFSIQWQAWPAYVIGNKSAMALQSPSSARRPKFGGRYIS